jgi:uncharacterized protein
MVVACLNIAMLVPESGSLKDKRQIVRSLKERIRSRFNVSVAEVDHQDMWQRATLGVAVVSADHAYARDALEKVSRFVDDDLRVSVLDVTLEVL